jgi:Family of unknown function (DUF6932)
VYGKLAKLLDEAAKSGIVKRMIVAGSFVTAKIEPNDYDCLLVLDASVTRRTPRPFEYNLVSRRAARRIFGGDVVPAIEGSAALDEYLEFFQTSRCGRPAGVVEIKL